ncbi:ABC transporter substrate-binding protein [Bacillus sp. FSL K6-3431]|uniref:ABC transporter substrate-binding protein n=1 Tax=Bacillus sp. FSL K6-3431 TaxID=2921500 RepID=UPI0030F83DF6
MLGFQPAEKVKQLIDNGDGFSDISEEVLPEYAGDVLFVLTDQSEETTTETENLLNSDTWKMIPAVKTGHVYIMDSLWNFDDPITRERLLDELPKLMMKN